MKVKGEIKVWVDGERCCARLTADGRQGPIAIQACAPLAEVRAFVKRALAERGQEMSGAGPEVDALVGRVARKVAMGRLMRLAPAAFVPGGVGAAIATHELRRRRQARLRAQPGPGKSIGPMDNDDRCERPEEREPDEGEGGERSRRIRRRHHRHHHRPDDVMGWRRRHRHPKRGQALLGDGSGADLMGWRRRNRHPRRQALLGAGPPPAAMALAPPQVQAAAALLSAAQRHPAAARKVARIAVRAQGGDPSAQHAMRALRVAKHMRSKQTKRSVARLASAQPSSPLLPPPRPAPLLPPLPSHAHAAPGVAAPRPPAASRHGLFWAWDPEHQKGRG